MRNRLVLAAAAFSAVALAAPGALAGTSAPVLDGVKTKKLTLTASGGVQSNDTVLVTSLTEDDDRVNCAAPRCAMLKFVYKPGKKVAGDVMFTLQWTNPASDMDLYIAEIGKSGNTEIGHCASSGQAQEKYFAPSGTFKPGRTYALVMDFFRSVNETATGTVEMPSASTIKGTVPAAADEFAAVNCTL